MIARMMVVFLGLLLTSVGGPAAWAHPSGPVVSTGSNPVVNYAGRRSAHGFFTVLSAPLDQDIVLTDLVFSLDISSSAEAVLRLAGSEVELGRYFLWGPSYNSGGLIHLNLQSGIRIPAGQSLELDTNSGRNLNYSFSGRYTRP
jgi:hypothetical protein